MSHRVTDWQGGVPVKSRQVQEQADTLPIAAKPAGPIAVMISLTQHPAMHSAPSIDGAAVPCKRNKRLEQGAVLLNDAVERQTPASKELISQDRA